MAVKKTKKSAKKGKKQKKAKGGGKTAARVLLFCVIMLLAGGAGAFFYLNEAPPDAREGGGGEIKIEDGEVFMEIKAGESASAVGRELKSAMLIKSAALWNVLYTLFYKIEHAPLKAGFYRFSTGRTMLELHGIFTRGQVNLRRVTIPEGSTLKKTAAILENAGVCPKDDFLSATTDKSLLEEYGIPAAGAEGYLFPDTYYFEARSGAETVVRAMLDNFYAALEKAGIDGKSMDKKALFEKVILASIIEREYRVAEEAPVMGGVFQNRLKAAMRLESCATVEYIITEIEDLPHPKRLFNKDLERKNPYNTYLYAGLPPGPISSPGIVALKAAFKPEENDFYFFRIAGGGRHYFSKTFDAHIKAGPLLVKER